jgi:ParB-like chromosome segregation protein Spo0J
MVKFTTPTAGKADSPKFVPAELIPNFAAYTGRQDRTAASIQEKVDSLLANGQLNSILVRKGFDGSAIPVTGHTRILAAHRINTERLVGRKLDVVTGNVIETQYGPENPFVLRADYTTMNETDAIFASLVENIARTEITDMDYILFLKSIESLNLTDTQIAQRLGVPTPFITNRRKAISLDAKTQKALASGTVKFDAALNGLGTIAPEARESVLNAVLAAGAKPTTANLKDEARKQGVTMANAVRTDKDVRNLINSLLVEGTLSEGPVRDLFFAIADFKSGMTTAEDVTAKAQALATPVKVKTSKVL